MIHSDDTFAIGYFSANGSIMIIKRGEVVFVWKQLGNNTSSRDIVIVSKVNKHLKFEKMLM